MKFTNNRPVSAPGGGSRAAQPFRYAMAPPPDNPTPPPAEPTDPSAAMITFADDWQALAEPTHAGMFRDEAHQREMLAMTGVIARRDACTHVAVQDGNWTDAKTWLVVSSGLFGLPGTGAIIGVPAGITVTMDNNTTTVFNRMRVDGKVTFAINQDTKLYIDDTIVVNHGGEWLHGTVANPIPAAYTSEVVFPSQTNLDGAKEKLLLQRGFLGMGANSMHPDGKIHVHGQVKDHWGTTNQSLAVGATSVTLDAAPTGWASGDSLHLMETTPYGWVSNFPATWSPRRVDNVTITGINTETNTITFTPATTYAHSVPTYTGMTDLKWYVVNFTRNVKYYSPVDTPIHQRAHWMAMGDGIDVRWASFDWLGRTNKKHDTPSFPATNDAARIAENGGTGDPDFSATDNVQGRYNLHVHRSGVEIGQEFATIVGASCTEAPGWLVAIHQSNTNCTKVVGRSFLGSGMVAEIGSEAGKWLDCFMGEGQRIDSAQGAQSDKQEPYSSVGPDKFGVTRTHANDFGRNNNCYWFRSRAIEIEGCVAAGADRGMVWMSRGSGGAIQNPTPASLPYDTRIFYGNEQAASSVGADRPVLLVKNCKIISVANPTIVIKSSSNQNHQLRTHIHGNDIWEVSRALQFEYTGHYTIDNNRIGFTTRSLNLRDRHAIFLAGASADFYISNNVVRNFADAVVNKITGPDTLYPSKDFGNVVVDNHTHNAAALIMYSGSGTGDLSSSLKVVDPAGLSSADPTWTPAAEPVWGNYTPPSGPNYVFVGNLTTEFGTRNRSHETSTTQNIASPSVGLSSRFNSTQLGLMLSRYGYYTYSGNNYLLVPDLISRKLPTTPGGDIPVRYLTVPVRLTGVSLGDYTPQGALPTRYVDAIVATTYVVYEDIFGVGNLYEGL